MTTNYENRFIKYYADIKTYIKHVIEIILILLALIRLMEDNPYTVEEIF